MCPATAITHGLKFETRPHTVYNFTTIFPSLVFYPGIALLGLLLLVGQMAFARPRHNAAGDSLFSALIGAVVASIGAASVIVTLGLFLLPFVILIIRFVRFIVFGYLLSFISFIVFCYSFDFYSFYCVWLLLVLIRFIMLFLLCLYFILLLLLLFPSFLPFIVVNY